MQYEMVVVVKPDTNEQSYQEKLTTLLEKEGFTVSNVSWWGKKPLAYPINKLMEGSIASFYLDTTGKNPNVLYAKLKLESEIVRILVVKQKEEKQ